MRNKTENHIPDDVYIQFVRSLFDGAHTVFLGALIHSLTAFLAYWHSGKPVYAVLTIILLMTGLWRFAGMLLYKKSGGIRTLSDALAWERSYIFRGTVHVLTLGTFCFVGIYFDSGQFAAVAALSVTVGSMTTVVGRNYGSKRMVAIFALAIVSPIGLGFVMHGQLPFIALGILIIPFYVIITGTADSVREVLFSAVVGHKEAGRLAQRFDRALNTMSHGLIMFGSDGLAVVANAQAAELLRFSSSRQLLKRSLKALLQRGVAGGLLTPQDCTYAEAQLTRALREGRDRKLLLRLADGRHFEFSAREGHEELGVVTFEDVTQRVEAEEKIRFMARYDSLTGLPNRAYFHERISEFIQAGDQERLCGLVVFDLDDFKSINDTLGHPVGDGLLYAVSERLSAFATEDVTVSRFGGDEFMAFFNNLSGEREFAERVQTMFASLNGDVDVAGHALHIQMSAGAVVSLAREADVDAMIVKADLALYKAKEMGKNGWRLFETDMDEAFRKRQIMKADLRGAIESRNLRVVYQPIVSVASMRMTGCEALCRWDHPELGPVSPAIFIPLAEEMGIVSEISTQVLRAACTRCVEWPDHICVSVNLSAKDFRNADVVDKVANALEISGLAPHRLEIEVTETALLDDRTSTRDFIERLKDLGVKIALDDFGTGYSSLSYLHTLPLDKVKIDRGFVVDITKSKRSLELLKGVVDLSHRLGLAVTVEGVETFEQFSRLAAEVNPELVQGFLFGSALTASGIETLAGQVWPFSAGQDAGNSKPPKIAAKS